MEKEKIERLIYLGIGLFFTGLLLGLTIILINNPVDKPFYFLMPLSMGTVTLSNVFFTYLFYTQERG